MRYDYLNRMVEYRDEAIRSVTRYSYDCLGRRVAKSSTIGEKRLEIKLVNSSGSWAHASSIFGEQLDKLPLSRYTVNV